MIQGWLSLRQPSSGLSSGLASCYSHRWLGRLPREAESMKDHELPEDLFKVSQWINQKEWPSLGRRDCKTVRRASSEQLRLTHDAGDSTDLCRKPGSKAQKHQSVARSWVLLMQKKGAWKIS